jgi:hypothetical protein
MLSTIGIVQVGEQTATITASHLRLQRTPPTVTLDACLDYSALHLIYRSTRRPVPDSRIDPPRVPATATVTWQDDGRWRVTSTRQAGRTCQARHSEQRTPAATTGDLRSPGR